MTDESNEDFASRMRERRGDPPQAPQSPTWPRNSPGVIQTDTADMIAKVAAQALLERNTAEYLGERLIDHDDVVKVARSKHYKESPYAYEVTVTVTLTQRRRILLRLICNTATSPIRLHEWGEELPF